MIQIFTVTMTVVYSEEVLHYHHQVQLQLLVGVDRYDWCDFCGYTPKGVELERIWLNIEWSEKCIIELDSYYKAYVLPEILCLSYCS